MISDETRRKMSEAKKGVSPANKLPTTIIICPICKKEFGVCPSLSKKRKFCSKVCADAAKIGKPPWNKSEHILLICDTCGIEFYVKPCKATKKTYCSKICADKAHSLIRGSNHPLYKEKIKKTCQNCGVDYFIIPARAKRGNSKFCSNHCAGAWTAKTCKSPSNLEISFAHRLQLESIVADFCITGTPIIVEIDGIYWHNLPKVASRDKQKDIYYKNEGYRTIHYMTDSKTNFNDLIDELRNALLEYGTDEYPMGPFQVQKGHRNQSD